MSQLVLASSSRYRRQLLETLTHDFQCASPDIDESPKSQESPKSLALRLAEQKALALKDDYPNHLIIGSDQTAAVDGVFLNKPGNAERAIEQLLAMQGKTITFYTGLALYDSTHQTMQSDVVSFDVTLRALSREQIERYVEKEAPFDCAGSFKVEGLGIVLFERLEGSDPNALIGLPMIRLVDFLNQANHPLL